MVPHFLLTGTAAVATLRGMQNRSSKRKPTDLNQLAKAIVEQATADEPTEAETPPNDETKNPAAVALGRLGGLKGGKARAEKLTAKKRSEIAKKAAAARWAKSNDQASS